MINIVLADTHPIFSEGIKLILEKDPHMSVAGCACGMEEVLELCRQHQPDVVLMDIAMPQGDGMEGMKRIKSLFGGIKVIIFTECRDAGIMLEAIRSGANGYVLKSINRDELIMTVKSAVMGLGVLHQEALTSFTEHMQALCGSPVLSRSPQEFKLTERELDIIHQIVEGKENREIARSLFMSEGTIKNAISGILRKVDVRDRIQLVVFAFRNGMV